ncbi:diguanylate cyclase domain-containing protein [Bacillus sp. SCS-153A]|uniref:sensor domain-containing diguanylate cyclase n=1 Tax=Rossellomorea sedimentorum TaxID=3115294 RepID=UPI0039068870
MIVYRGRLQKLLAISFGVIAILLILVLSILIGQRSIKEVQSEIGQSLSEVAYIVGENLDQYMWSRYEEVAVLSELPEIKKQQDLSNVENLLNRLREKIPSFSWVGLTDKDGVVIASTDGILRGADISARPVYTEALDEVFIGDVHEAVLLADLLPNPSGEEMKFVDISTPVYDYDNQFIGVLATHLSWEWVEEAEESMMNTLQNRSNIELFIISDNNNVILGPDDMLGNPLNLESLESAKMGKEGWILETWEDRNQYLTGYVFADGYKDYPGLNWTILVRQPVEVAYAPAKELLIYFIVTGLVLVALFALAGWFLAGRITYPLKKISRVADHLREGKMVEIPNYKGIIEIEILSDSLRNLVANLTKKESELEKMEDVAHRDHLTGLCNRNGLEHYLERATKHNKALTILYMDLDGFKAVNDQLGHDAGDKLLVEVGSRLKQNIREGELVSRMGGDEFVIVLTSSALDPINNGVSTGERIISMINKPYDIDGEIVSVGCSIGGAVWTPSDNISDVIRRADQALYQVKRTGKNKVSMVEVE